MSHRDRDDPRACAEIGHLDGCRRSTFAPLREFVAVMQDSLDQEFRLWARYEHIASDGKIE